MWSSIKQYIFPRHLAMAFQSFVCLDQMPTAMNEEEMHGSVAT